MRPPVADNSCGGRNVNQPATTSRPADAAAPRDAADNSSGGGAVANGYNGGGGPASATMASGLPFWMRGTSQKCDTSSDQTTDRKVTRPCDLPLVTGELSS